MTKSVRFLIVFIIFLMIIIFSQGNDLHQTVVEMPTPTFSAEPTAVAVATDAPTRQRNLVLIEFFSGL